MSAYPGPQSATVSRVATSGTVATLFAATGAAANRIVQNESAVTLYIKFGPAATSTDYTVSLAAGGLYEFPKPTYSGIVTGILASGSGNAQCTGY